MPDRSGRSANHSLGELLFPVNPAFDHFDVGENQLHVDRFDVADRVNCRIDVDDIAVFKAADDVNDPVHLADVGEEAVAEPLALGGAADQTGDVDKFDDSRRHLVGLIHVRQHVEPVVGHRDNADVRVDCAEGIVGRFRFACGHGVEERAFPDIGESDDT